MTMPVSNAYKVLRRPRFAQRVTIKRRTQTVGEDGRTVTSETTLTPVGVITAGSVEDLVRDEDYEHGRNSIVVHCTERLLDATTGYLPDIIVHDGSNYLVKRSYNWSQYGKGFFAADCEMQDLTSAAP